jgi:hypothetical protein
MSLSITRRLRGGVEVYLHSFLSLALDRDEWSKSHPGLYTPGKIPTACKYKDGWASEPVWTVLLKTKYPFLPQGFETWAVLPVASRYPYPFYCFKYQIIIFLPSTTTYLKWFLSDFPTNFVYSFLTFYTRRRITYVPITNIFTV